MAGWPSVRLALRNTAACDWSTSRADTSPSGFLVLPAGTGPGRAGGRRGGEGLLSSGVLAQFHTSDTKVNRPRRQSRGHRHPRVQAAAAHPPDEARLRGCELRGWTLNTRARVAGRQQLGLGTAAAQRALHWLTCTVASPSVAWPAGTTMPATTTHHRVL